MRIRVLAALDAANGFLLFHAALLALGNEPTLAAYSAQNTAFYDLLAESFEQHILRFILA